jgi:hypothetical protein
MFDLVLIALLPLIGGVLIWLWVRLSYWLDKIDQQ